MADKKQEVYEVVGIVTAIIGLIQALKSLFGDTKKKKPEKPQDNA